MWREDGVQEIPHYQRKGMSPIFKKLRRRNMMTIYRPLLHCCSDLLQPYIYRPILHGTLIFFRRFGVSSAYDLIFYMEQGWLQQIPLPPSNEICRPYAKSDSSRRMKFEKDHQDTLWAFVPSQVYYGAFSLLEDIESLVSRVWKRHLTGLRPCLHGLKTLLSFYYSICFISEFTLQFYCVYWKFCVAILCFVWAPSILFRACQSRAK